MTGQLEPIQRISRRSVLKTGAGVGAAVALGGAGMLLGSARPAGAHGTLYPNSEIGGIPTYYQDLTNGSSWAQTFSYQQNLYDKLEEWLVFYYRNTPSTYLWPGKIYLNGTHVDNGSGMHPYGRAADISQIDMYNSGAGFTFDAFNGRYNVWRNSPYMAEYRRRYWATVCGLNIYCKYVLHYAYNSIHHNHVHVDNEASNGSYSTFTTGSRSQVLAVQAACNYIWGLGTAVDGGWGPQTDGHSRTVLGWAGRSGGITDSQANWHRFCWAAMRAGHALPISGLSLATAGEKPWPGR